MKLSDEVEAPEGPCREVDLLVATLTRKARNFDKFFGKRIAKVAKPYTASIDAALTLMPEGCILTELSENDAAKGMRQEGYQISGGLHEDARNEIINLRKDLANTLEENRVLSAGSCDVVGGKIGDERGNTYCGIQTKLEKSLEYLRKCQQDASNLRAERDALRKAAMAVRDDLIFRAEINGDHNVVGVGVGVWIQLNDALGNANGGISKDGYE